MKIQENLHWIGVYDPSLKIFDVEMPTNGTTYNSYLVRGEVAAVIDTVKAGFYESFLNRLGKLTPLSLVKYVVVNHTEPDHTGSLGRLLAEIPQAKVVCTKTAKNFLEAQFNRKFDCLIAEEIGRLDLGGGMVLEFVKAPFLHWPDTMVTYLPAYETLFSCDAFGAHYCEEGKLFDDEMGDHFPAARFYYEAIVSPFNPHVRKALSLLENHQLSLICPSHGPILRSRLKEMLQHYAEWSKEVLSFPSATLLFSSAYGNTELLAKALRKGLEEEGISVKEIKAEHGFDSAAAIESAHNSHALLVGSPTITADAVGSIWEVLGHLNPIRMKGKPGLAFGSYGWSGEAVKSIESRFDTLGLKPVEGMKVNFVPTENDLAAARELGKNFALQIKERVS